MPKKLVISDPQSESNAKEATPRSRTRTRRRKQCKSACIPCRDAKKKCNNKKPCSRCIRMKLHCVRSERDDDGSSSCADEQSDLDEDLSDFQTTPKPKTNMLSSTRRRRGLSPEKIFPVALEALPPRRGGPRAKRAKIASPSPSLEEEGDQTPLLIANTETSSSLSTTTSDRDSPSREPTADFSFEEVLIEEDCPDPTVDDFLASPMTPDFNEFPQQQWGVVALKSPREAPRYDGPCPDGKEHRDWKVTRYSPKAGSGFRFSPLPNDQQAPPSPPVTNLGPEKCANADLHSARHPRGTQGRARACSFERIMIGSEDDGDSIFGLGASWQYSDTAFDFTSGESAMPLPEMFPSETEENNRHSFSSAQESVLRWADENFDFSSFLVDPSPSSTIPQGSF